MDCRSPLTAGISVAENRTISNGEFFALAVCVNWRNIEGIGSGDQDRMIRSLSDRPICSHYLIFGHYRSLPNNK